MDLYIPLASPEAIKLAVLASTKKLYMVPWIGIGNKSKGFIIVRIHSGMTDIGLWIFFLTIQGDSPMPSECLTTVQRFRRFFLVKIWHVQYCLLYVTWQITWRHFDLHIFGQKRRSSSVLLIQKHGATNTDEALQHISIEIQARRQIRRFWTAILKSIYGVVRSCNLQPRGAPQRTCWL